MTKREQELDAEIRHRSACECCSETMLLMTEWLDRAVHGGESWARPVAPREVWLDLLDDVAKHKAVSDAAAGYLVSIRMGDEEGTRLSRLVNEALQVDGGHHKQWYLERIAFEFELNVDGDHEPGVAP